jgi:hypothetical protein
LLYVGYDFQVSWGEKSRARHKLNLIFSFLIVTRVARWLIFKPKIPFWVNFGGSRLEKGNMCYGHLENFMDIWEILWPFGKVCFHLVHFFRFWYHVPRKIWQPCLLLDEKVFLADAPTNK